MADICRYHKLLIFPEGNRAAKADFLLPASVFYWSEFGSA